MPERSESTFRDDTPPSDPDFDRERAARRAELEQRADELERRVALTAILDRMPTATVFLDQVLGYLNERTGVEIVGYDEDRPIAVRRHMAELVDKMDRAPIRVGLLSPLEVLATFTADTLWHATPTASPMASPLARPPIGLASLRSDAGRIRIYRPGPDQIGDVGTIDTDRPHCMRGLEEPGHYLHFHIALAADAG